jgi:hypothetical protein
MRKYVLIPLFSIGLSAAGLMSAGLLARNPPGRHLLS